MRETSKKLDERGISLRMRAVCGDVLDRAIALAGADYGNLQLVNAGGTGMEIVVQRGFNKEFINRFKFIPISEGATVCARAAQRGGRLMIRDVEQDPAFRKHLAIARSVPFRAVMSFPLQDSKGHLIGVVSTHFRDSRLPDKRHLDNFDRYLHTAAQMIERALTAGSSRVRKEDKRGMDARGMLRSLDALKDLPHEDMDSLFNIGKVRNYKKGDKVITMGSKADRLFVVINGWVKTFNAGGGKESGIRLLTQGGTFGAGAIFDDARYFVSAESVTRAQMMELGATRLLKLVQDRPAIARWIMHQLAAEIKERQIHEASLGLEILSRRVGCLLLRLTAWMKGKGGTFRMPYRKSLAAAQINIGQSTFSRALARLKAFGVSSSNGEFTIDDFAALSEHCCFDCAFNNGQCAGQRLNRHPPAR